MRSGLFQHITQLAPRLKRLPALIGARWSRGRHTAWAGLVSMGLRALFLLGKFAFILVLAKYTDTATVGIYSLLVTTISISIYLIGLEIHTYTGRELVADQGGTQAAVHVQNHFQTVAAIFLLTLPIIWGFTVWLGFAGKFSFLLFSVILLLEALGQELGRYLLILSRPVASSVLQFIRGAAWMPVPTVWLILGNGGGWIDVILWSWLCGSLGACVFGFWRIRGFLAPLHRFRLSWFGGAFLSARHYFAVAMLTQAQYYSDRFVVQYFLGEKAVGVLSFYQSFANTMVAFVQTGVIGIILPRLLLAASQNDVVAERGVRRSMFASAVGLAVVISALLAVGMPFLLREMGKGAYEGALPIFYLLLLGNLALIPGLIVHLSLYARRRDADLLRVSLIVIPLSLLGSILVVPSFGLMGSACVFIATAAADFLLKYHQLRRMPPETSLPDMGV